MKRIKACASSANLGPGFDCLGLALDLYNVYAYRLSSSSRHELRGFDKRYSDPDRNLVLKSYLHLFASLNKKPLPIYIEQVEQNIPASRGLGSSSACIVAGMGIANDILGNIVDEAEILRQCAAIEGHPDNVAPALLGGLVISRYDGKEVIAKKVGVSPDLHFAICIPPFELATKKAREALPKKVHLQDAVANIANALLLIEGFEEGDIDLIRKSIDDHLHVPYRAPLINGAKELMEFGEVIGAAITISGAGSTLLAISKEDISAKLKAFLPKEWEVKEVRVNRKGSEIDG